MDNWTTTSHNFRTFLLVSQIDPAAIQARIKQARREKGLTQQELAELIERHKRTVENYENVRVPDWPELTKIARVLDKPIEWFLHGDREEEGDVKAQLHALVEGLAEVRTDFAALDRKLDVANLDQRMLAIEREVSRLVAAVVSNA
jgi:transcriptional regulator with XRE-family HTH domain